MATCRNLLLFFLVLAAADAQWPRFRGPNGSGVDGAAGYTVEFSLRDGPVTGNVAAGCFFEHDGVFTHQCFPFPPRSRNAFSNCSFTSCAAATWVIF